MLQFILLKVAANHNWPTISLYNLHWTCRVSSRLICIVGCNTLLYCRLRITTHRQYCLLQTGIVISFCATTSGVTRSHQTSKDLNNYRYVQIAIPNEYNDPIFLPFPYFLWLARSFSDCCMKSKLLIAYTTSTPMCSSWSVR